MVEEKIKYVCKNCKKKCETTFKAHAKSLLCLKCNKEKLRIMYECIRMTSYLMKRKSLLRDNDTCTMCGSKEYLLTHHKRYRIPPRLNDLTTLCKNCHRKAHGKNVLKVFDDYCKICESRTTYRTKTELVCRNCGNREKL